MLIKKMTINQVLGILEQQKAHQVDSPYSSGKLDDIDVKTLDLTIEKLEGFKSLHGGDYEIPDDLAHAVNNIPYNKTTINKIHGLVVKYCVNYPPVHKAKKERKEKEKAEREEAQSNDKNEFAKSKFKTWLHEHAGSIVGSCITILLMALGVVLKLCVQDFQECENTVFFVIESLKDVLGGLGGKTLIDAKKNNETKEGISKKALITGLCLTIAAAVGAIFIFIWAILSAIPVGKWAYAFLEFGCVGLAVFGLILVLNQRLQNKA